MNLENIGRANEYVLMELLERATTTNCSGSFDAMATRLFCMVIKDNEELIGRAHELLVLKMHSPNVEEALKGIEILRECMMLCGSSFQKKTAKFKFLNKLLEMVDEQRRSGREETVALEVRQKIMECLLLWSVEYPDKVKIRECYDDLKRKVSFGPETTTTTTTMKTVKTVASRSQDENILGKDNALVAKLLREGGPENLQAANLLIQNRVHLKTKQEEMVRDHRSKLQQIDNCLEVLNAMLDNYSAEEKVVDTTLSDLYGQCLEYEACLKPICYLNTMLDKQTLAETKSSHEMLVKCLNRYREIVQNDDNRCRLLSVVHCSNNSLQLDETDNDTDSGKRKKDSPQPETSVSNIELLSSILITNDDQQTSLTTRAGKSTAEELSELFGNSNSMENGDNSMENDLLHTNAMDSKDDPSSMMVVGDDDLRKNGKEVKDDDKQLSSSSKDKELMKSIDELSEELFKHQLNSEQRRHSFKSVPRKKVPTLNELTSNSNHLHEGETEQSLNWRKGESLAMIPAEDLEKCYHHELLVTSKEPEIVLLNDDHVCISLKLANIRSTPPQILLIQLSVMNKSMSLMSNLQFSLGVKKPCKVRLLAPQSSFASRFLVLGPGLQLEQRLLLRNPLEKEEKESVVELTGILQYTLPSDVDPFTAPFRCNVPTKSL